MRVTNYSTKLFLDSGDPRDTEHAIKLLGSIDGQTTNPSLVAKNPTIQKAIESGKRFTNDDLLNEYKSIITDISTIIPDGSVSIEVYADEQSTAHDLLRQAEDMNEWVSNAHIKFPTTIPGLHAASKFVSSGGKANMTLGFSLAQALAVHQATEGSHKGDVFYSSFIGRLFDKGVNGVESIKSVVQLYRSINSHVEVLAASFRNLDQLKAAILADCDIVTIPPKLLDQWKDTDFEIDDGFTFHDDSVEDFVPDSLTESFEWTEDLAIPEQANEGVTKFAQDWNNLLS
jgi:transaldolase